MDPHLSSVADVLVRTDDRLRTPNSGVRLWPTGFDPLDEALNGGLRAGTLTLVAGAQGQGKTTFALQVARNCAREGRAVLYFCYEHDAEAMLAKLVAMEAGEAGGVTAPNLSQVREVFESPGSYAGGLAERFSGQPAVIEALMHIEKYGDRLIFHRSTGAKTSLKVITDRVAEVRAETGEAPLVIVDYLQKVNVPGHLSSDEAATLVTEGLKDLALETEAPVFAIAAADHAGLEANQRLRVRHLRGSTALAYEPDAVLVLSGKNDIVSRNHLVYDMSNLDRFADWAVLTIEKSRFGRTGESFEFRSRFSQSRYEPLGRVITEKLIDERVYTE